MWKPISIPKDYYESGEFLKDVRYQFNVRRVTNLSDKSIEYEFEGLPITIDRIKLAVKSGRLVFDGTVVIIK